MGEWIDAIEWEDRVWRTAADDSTAIIRHFRPHDPIAHDMVAVNRILSNRGLTWGSPDWWAAKAEFEPERAWCRSDACHGLWSSTFVDEWGCDQNGGDIILGRQEAWFFSDPVSAIEFKLRWC